MKVSVRKIYIPIDKTFIMHVLYTWRQQLKREVTQVFSNLDAGNLLCLLYFYAELMLEKVIHGHIVKDLAHEYMMTIVPYKCS